MHLQADKAMVSNHGNKNKIQDKGSTNKNYLSKKNTLPVARYDSNKDTTKLRGRTKNNLSLSRNPQNKNYSTRRGDQILTMASPSSSLGVASYENILTSYPEAEPTKTEIVPPNNEFAALLREQYLIQASTEIKKSIGDIVGDDKKGIILFNRHVG